MLISINWALLREQKTWLLNQPCGPPINEQEIQELRTYAVEM